MDRGDNAVSTAIPKIKIGICIVPYRLIHFQPEDMHEKSPLPEAPGERIQKLAQSRDQGYRMPVSLPEDMK